MLQNIRIALTIDKRQTGTSTPDIVSVCGVVSVVPMPIFVFDRLIQFCVCSFARAKQGSRYDFCQFAVTESVEVNPIQRVSLTAASVQIKRRMEKIDEGLSGFFCSSARRVGVNLKIGIQLNAIWQMSIPFVFVGDRTE